MKFICTALLLVALYQLSLTSHASPWLEINGWSKHTPGVYIDAQGDERKFNSRNFGLGVMFTLTPNVEAGFGFYNNSYHRTTVYPAAVDLHTDTNRLLRVGVMVSPVTGYDNTNMFVLPNAVLSTGHVRIRLGYVPPAIAGLALYTVSLGIHF